MEMEMEMDVEGQRAKRSELSFRSNPDILMFPEDGRVHGHEIATNVATKLSEEYKSRAEELNNRVQGLGEPMKDDTRPSVVDIATNQAEFEQRIETFSSGFYEPPETSDVKPFHVEADNAETVWPWAEYLKAVGNTVSFYEREGETPSTFDYCKNISEKVDKITEAEKSGADALQEVSSSIISTMALVLGFESGTLGDVKKKFETMAKVAPQTRLEAATAQVAFLIEQYHADTTRLEKKLERCKKERNAVLERYTTLREASRTMINASQDIQERVGELTLRNDYERLVDADIMIATGTEFQWASDILRRGQVMDITKEWPDLPLERFARLAKMDVEQLTAQLEAMVPTELDQFDPGFVDVATTYLEPTTQIIAQMARERSLIIEGASFMGKRNKKKLLEAMEDYVVGQDRILVSDVQNATHSYGHYVKSFRKGEEMKIDVDVEPIADADTLSMSVVKISEGLKFLSRNVIKPVNENAVEHAIKEIARGKKNLQKFYNRFLFKADGTAVEAYQRLKRQIPDAGPLPILYSTMPEDIDELNITSFEKLDGYMQDAAKDLLEEHVQREFTTNLGHMYSNMGMVFSDMNDQMLETLQRFVEGMEMETTGGIGSGGRLTTNLEKLKYAPDFVKSLSDIRQKTDRVPVDRALVDPSSEVEGFSPTFFHNAQKTVKNVAEGYQLVYTTLVLVVSRSLEDRTSEKDERKKLRKGLKEQLTSLVTRFGATMGGTTPMGRFQNMLDTLIESPVKEIESKKGKEKSGKRLRGQGTAEPIVRGFNKFGDAVERAIKLTQGEQSIGALTETLGTLLTQLYASFKDANTLLEDTNRFYDTEFLPEVGRFVTDLKSIRPDLNVLAKGLDVVVEGIEKSWSIGDRIKGLKATMELMLEIVNGYKRGYDSCASVITQYIGPAMKEIQSTIDEHINKGLRELVKSLEGSKTEERLALSKAVRKIEEISSVNRSMTTRGARLRDLVPAEDKLIGEVARESLQNLGRLFNLLSDVTELMVPVVQKSEPATKVNETKEMVAKCEARNKKDSETLETQLIRWTEKFGTRSFETSPMARLQTTLDALIGPSVEERRTKSGARGGKQAKRKKAEVRGFNTFGTAVDVISKTQIQGTTVINMATWFGQLLDALDNSFRDVNTMLEDTNRFYDTSFKTNVSRFVTDLNDIRPDLKVLGGGLDVIVDRIAKQWTYGERPDGLKARMNLVVDIVNGYKKGYESCVSVITKDIGPEMKKIQLNIDGRFQEGMRKLAKSLEGSKTEERLALTKAATSVGTTLGVIPSMTTRSARLRDLVPAEGKLIGNIAGKSLQNLALLFSRISDVAEHMVPVVQKSEPTTKAIETMELIAQRDARVNRLASYIRSLIDGSQSFVSENKWRGAHGVLEEDAKVDGVYEGLMDAKEILFAELNLHTSFSERSIMRIVKSSEPPQNIDTKVMRGFVDFANGELLDLQRIQQSLLTVARRLSDQHPIPEHILNELTVSYTSTFAHVQEANQAIGAFLRAWFVLKPEVVVEPSAIALTLERVMPTMAIQMADVEGVTKFVTLPTNDVTTMRTKLETLEQQVSERGVQAGDTVLLEQCENIHDWMMKLYNQVVETIFVNYDTISAPVLDMDKVKMISQSYPAESIGKALAYHIMMAMRVKQFDYLNLLVTDVTNAVNGPLELTEIIERNVPDIVERINKLSEENLRWSKDVSTLPYAREQLEQKLADEEKVRLYTLQRRVRNEFNPTGRGVVVELVKLELDTPRILVDEKVQNNRFAYDEKALPGLYPTFMMLDSFYTEALVHATANVLETANRMLKVNVAPIPSPKWEKDPCKFVSKIGTPEERTAYASQLVTKDHIGNDLINCLASMIVNTQLLVFGDTNQRAIDMKLIPGPKKVPDAEEVKNWFSRLPDSERSNILNTYLRTTKEQIDVGTISSYEANTATRGKETIDQVFGLIGLLRSKGIPVRISEDINTRTTLDDKTKKDWVKVVESLGSDTVIESPPLSRTDKVWRDQAQRILSDKKIPVLGTMKELGDANGILNRDLEGKLGKEEFATQRKYVMETYIEGAPKGIHPSILEFSTIVLMYIRSGLHLVTKGLTPASKEMFLIAGLPVQVTGTESTTVEGLSTSIEEGMKDVRMEEETFASELASLVADARALGKGKGDPISALLSAKLGDTLMDETPESMADFFSGFFKLEEGAMESDVGGTKFKEELMKLAATRGTSEVADGTVELKEREGSITILVDRVATEMRKLSGKKDLALKVANRTAESVTRFAGTKRKQPTTTIEVTVMEEEGGERKKKRTRRQPVKSVKRTEAISTHVTAEQRAALSNIEKEDQDDMNAWSAQDEKDRDDFGPANRLMLLAGQYFSGLDRHTDIHDEITETWTQATKMSRVTSGQVNWTNVIVELIEFAGRVGKKPIIYIPSEQQWINLFTKAGIDSRPTPDSVDPGELVVESKQRDRLLSLEDADLVGHEIPPSSTGKPISSGKHAPADVVVTRLAAARRKTTQRKLLIPVVLKERKRVTIGLPVVVTPSRADVDRKEEEKKKKSTTVPKKRSEGNVFGFL